MNRTLVVIGLAGVVTFLVAHANKAKAAPMAFTPGPFTGWMPVVGDNRPGGPGGEMHPLPYFGERGRPGIDLYYPQPVIDEPILLSGRIAPPDGLGDVDGDGVVTNKDAELVAGYIVGNVQLTPDQMRRADVNKDGRVTIGDSLFIAQYVNGQREAF